MKKYNNPQIKYVIVAFVFFLLSTIAFFTLYNKIRTNELLVQELESSWQTESTRRYDLNSLARTLRDVEDDVGKLNSHFVHAYNVVAFLDELEKLGALVSVKAEIISVDSAKGSTGEVLAVGVRATGTFTAIYKFLNLLESSQYEIDISTIDLKRQETDVGLITPLWGSTFKINVLSFIP